MTHPARGVPRPPPSDRTLDALLAALTPEQEAAVCHGRGPLLIVAGPGPRPQRLTPRAPRPPNRRRGSGPSLYPDHPEVT